MVWLPPGLTPMELPVPPRGRCWEGPLLGLVPVSVNGGHSCTPTLECIVHVGGTRHAWQLPSHLGKGPVSPTDRSGCSNVCGPGSTLANSCCGQQLLATPLNKLVSKFAVCVWCESTTVMRGWLGRVPCIHPHLMPIALIVSWPWLVPLAPSPCMLPSCPWPCPLHALPLTKSALLLLVWLLL